jgi:hypothetical protein
MRSPVLCALVSLFIPSFATAQTPVSNRALSPAQAQQDFAVLKSGLEEMHEGLYRFSTKAAMDAHFAALGATLARGTSLVDFYALISDVVASVGDGHLQLEESDSVNETLAAERLVPLRFLIEDNRLVVLYNDTPADASVRPGMEVLGINGISSAEILAKILPNLRHDGFIETGRKVRLGRAFGAYYWLFVDRAGEFAIKVRDAAGAERVVTLPGIRGAERAANKNPLNAPVMASVAKLDGSRDNVQLEWLDGSKLARIRIRMFEGDEFPAALESAFRQLRERKTTSLIIDIRGNGGGIDEHGMLLLSHLVTKPFRYFDRIHVKTTQPSFATWPKEMVDDLRAGVRPDPNGGFLLTGRRHPGLTEFPASEIPFLGKLYVLTDGVTFSTASDAAAHIRHLTSATFIGEETGGTYEGNTSGMNASLTLPNSGFRVRIGLYGYYSGVAPPKEPGRGVLPDYPVARRVQDILASVDAPLDRAVALARANESSNGRK